MCWAVRFLTTGLQRHLAAIFGGGRAAKGLWTENQPAGELLGFQPVYVFLKKLKLKKNKTFFIILNSIYFKAIQTAVYYQKNTYNTIERWPQKISRMVC